MVASKKEELYLLQLAEKQKKRKKNGWKTEEEIEEKTELQSGVDIVIINTDKMQVNSITVWRDLVDKYQIKGLCKRETINYQKCGEQYKNIKAVPLLARSVGLGDIIKVEEIIKI
jgi:hypothetical protein